MIIQPMDFIYDKGNTVISQKQFDTHSKLYKGYVDKVNEVTDILSSDGEQKNANSTYSKYRGLKRGETFALDGVILHELYFENIGQPSEMPPAEFSQTIQDNFSGKENWLDDFKACGKASRGWCILCYEQRTKTFRNISLDAHDFGLVAYIIPLIALDMYEHAYFLDYATDKNKYIDNFVKNINWDVVQKRMNCLKTSPKK